MQINLIDLLWIVLIVLIIVGMVVLFQLVLILFDVRQVTRRIRKVFSALNLAEYLFDEEDVKIFFGKCRKALSKIFKFFVDSLRALTKGGGKDG